MPGHRAGTGRLAVGAPGRREARGAGVSTERSAAERASTRRPEESLSAWDRERPRPRGRPAPQRRSARHADTGRVKVPRRWRRAEPGRPSNRGSMTDPRSGARGSVGTGNGYGNGIGNGCDLAHIYTYIPLPTQHERPSCLLPPDSVRGRRHGGASVCGRARARTISISGPVASSKQWGCSRNRALKEGYSSHPDLGISERHAEERLR